MDKVPHVHLPPGYRVEWVEGSLSLFAPRDRLVLTYPATARVLLTIEEHAWQDAVRQLHSDTTQEIREFRAGVRSVEGLHRMRQYVGLMEALADALPDALLDKPVQEPVAFRRRRSRARGLVVAGGLAVAALLALVILPADTPVPRSATVVAPLPRAIATPPPRKSPTAPAARPAVLPPSIRQTVKAPPIQRRARTVTGYVTIFGRFTSLQAAQVHARRVRAKGYLATVIRAGTSFHVRSRIYPTRTQAERMAGIFREIGLPASVQRAGL